MLLVKKDNDKQVLLAQDQAWMESSSDYDQEINANMVFMAQIEKVLSESDKINTFEEKNNKFNEQMKVLNEKNADLLYQTKVLKDQLQVKLVVIDTHVECHEKYAKLEEERYEYMIRYSALFDNDKQHRKQIADQEVLFDKMSVELQTSSLKPYVPNVILKKIIIDLEHEVVNLLKKEKANLETIKYLKSKGFESSETAISESENQSENDCLVVEKECDKVENSEVIALGMFKLNVSQSVSPISMSKSSCESNNAEIKLKRKRHIDTFSSVRRPKHSGVILKKKGSSNTSNADLSYESLSNLNKNVKRYSCKDLLSCNNSHLGETSSAYMCNDTMNVSCCNSRMNDLLDDNNFFIFDDESVRISPVSKMPFRKKPHDSMNVPSKSNMIKSLPRTIFQIYLWIIDSGCSKHMTGNRALLTNFVEKFLGTVRFGNNDFAVIAGYGDVVIGSMTIKRIYYVEGLGHNLFSIGQFCDKILDSRCSKHMTGNRALLTNFVEKFLGTVRFGNNDFAVIAGYEDVIIGSMTIKNVYYVED
nr:integrase, catalytic region, zinc finger, CCHC-type, peptidase aspartic, catalytic [Tanacetum cinerariifolium]